MEAETKISLGAVVVLLCSLIYVYLVSFSNQISELSAAVAVVAADTAVAVAAVAVAAVVAAVTITIICCCYDKGQKKGSCSTGFLIAACFCTSSCRGFSSFKIPQSQPA